MPNQGTRIQVCEAVDRRTAIKSIGMGAVGFVTGCKLPHPVRATTSAEVLRRKRLRALDKPVPLNAEPELQALVRSWITPIEHFYIRNHAAIPPIDPETYRLHVDGLVERARSFRLGELQTEFPKTAITTTMTCAGNRRDEHNRVRKVEGVQWGAGATGNANWAGARLSDVLRSCGVQSQARHVWFTGLDEIDKNGRVISFGGSIPLERAMPSNPPVPDVLICYEMNGRPLRPEHGYPVRAVVPGYIGARSVKWLGGIRIERSVSTNHYVARAYKLVTEDDDGQWSAADPLYNYRLNSVICVPRPGARVVSGRLAVEGYALAAGIPERSVVQVELSSDGGRTWTQAELRPPEMPMCWRLWRADVSVGLTAKSLVVRATDSAGDTQPRTVPWNLKGYMNNSWHEVPISPS